MIEPPVAQQILRAKIFAEYVALFEAFGVLCLAIAKRKKQSLVWTYLNTEPQEVAQFYDSIRRTATQSLQRWLKLPSLSEVQKATSGPKKSITGLFDDSTIIDIEKMLLMITSIMLRVC